METYKVLITYDDLIFTDGMDALDAEDAWERSTWNWGKAQVTVLGKDDGEEGRILWQER